MSWEYSENVLVQNSAMQLLHDCLGWETIYAYNKEILGEDGTLGRHSYKDILLKRYLKKALLKNNDWLTDELCIEAIATLDAFIASDSLIQINEKIYNMLLDGIPMKVKKADGTQKDCLAKVFDLNNPQNNHFLAVQEMKIHGDIYRRRTDIVGFVNGIPLLFVELKAHNVDVKAAYDNNYQDYLMTIPKLFHYNAFIMFSNGCDAKIGTLGSKYEFFHEWKRLKEADSGFVDLDTMLRGICNKENFMDLLENYLVYDKSTGTTAKILARNHQFIGVNEVIEAYKNRHLKAGKLGVFWHTQGSGKSYSMVFLARKIRRRFAGSPTFVILTDREELNKQISDTFEACGCLGNEQARQYIPASGQRLTEMLKGNPSFIFTLIHKFNQSNPEPIIPKHEIIILSDEAHRTQNGIFADNMCTLLPTALRIGFTGTPLFSYDNITERTFGQYVSIYDFKRAVDDGATVPLYYQNRADLLEIVNPEINEKLLNAIEEAELDVNQQAKLERELSKEIHILTSTERLEKIAQDFVEHYTNIWETGKAMFVCMNKVTAVRMHDLVQEYWSKKIVEVKAALASATQQEHSEIFRKLEWLRETEMAVIVSQEQNEITTFQKWGLEILPHRELMEKREMDKEFKDPSNPFRIVFVCAMWLTGFDVPSLSTIYLDKPLKAHTLMQTIARANRVYEGKSNGLVVDYIGVVKALREALAEYTSKDEEGKQNPILNKSQLLERIFALMKEIADYMRKYKFNLTKLVNSDNFEKLALLKEAANAMCESMESKKHFEILARELFKLFKFVDNKEVTSEQRAYKNAISAIYNHMQEKRKFSDNTDLMVKLHDIVSEHVFVLENATGLTESKNFDISHIDFERLQQEFSRAKNKNLLFKDLNDLVEERLAVMLRKNPLRIAYYERYQQIIEEFNKEQNKAEIEAVFVALTKFVNDLDDEDKRFAREGFDSDEELAMFDLLLKKSLTPKEIKKVKELSKLLLDKVRKQIHELHEWRNKEETRATIKKLIEETLWSEMPESYDDTSLEEYNKQVYEFIYSVYPAA